jgi:excisionase family DNA binding protein
MTVDRRNDNGTGRTNAVAAHRHLTPVDLAEREDVSLDTVYRWNRVGTGPRYMRIGRHVRYRLDDVEAWENSRYVQRAGGAA